MLVFFLNPPTPFFKGVGGLWWGAAAAGPVGGIGFQRELVTDLFG